MKDTIKDQFAQALAATGVQLQTSAVEVATFAASRSAHLAAASAEPGFAQVMQDEQLRVWLFAANRTVRAGDAADARAFGLIQGLLLGAASA